MAEEKIGSVPGAATVEVCDKKLAVEVPYNSNQDDTDVEAATVLRDEEKEPENPYLVDWDGPHDPSNPMNWAVSMKARQIAGMAFNSFLTPLSSSMFAPGEADVLAEFRNTNTTLGSFVVSIFILGYVFGPLIMAPLSEIHGRLWCYHSCNVLFLVFTIACAVAQTLPQLFVFRFLAGVAGSCPLTLGSGTASDLVVKEKRAGVMTLWAMGPVLGPVVGPVAGSFVCARIGWRWVFWIIAITTGVMLATTLLLYRETYAPVLLERKAARLRKESGGQQYRSKFDSGLSEKEILYRAAVRPFKLPLAHMPPMTLFASISYGYLYLMFTTITAIFENTYGWSQEISGLAYLGFGIGCMAGLMVTGRVANRIAAKHSAQGRFTPESRLPPILAGCWFMPVGLFWYGWSAEKHVHWIMPIIGTCIFGVGLMSTFVAINTYLVDSYLRYAASVTAANTVLRSLVGAVLPLAGPSMYKKLGLGWGNSLLAFIALVCCGFPIFFRKYGAAIRTNPKFKLEL